jgi:hypothetical protein
LRWLFAPWFDEVLNTAAGFLQAIFHRGRKPYE